MLGKDDVAEPSDYDPKERGSPNTTDYDFPEGWGAWTDEMRCEWLTRNRVARQAARQETVSGRSFIAEREEKDRISAEEFRYDSDG